MTPEVLAALCRVVDELGADAGVLLRLTPSGACVVTSSTLVPALGVDDVWSSAGSLNDPDFRPELVLDPDRLAHLVPAGVLRALAVEPRGTLVAPLEDQPLRLVLLWTGAPPPVDVTSSMESEAMRRFSALAPELDAQVRARESAARLRAVVSALDQAVVVTVAGDVMANVNAAAARLLGLEPGHVDGTTLATAMRALRERAVDPDVLGVEVARLRKSATAVAHDWVWHLRGSPSHLRVTSVPVDTTTEQGRVWVFDDISAEMELLEREQRANQALAASEERYRLLAENVSDVVMLATADGTITWVSPSVTAALGWVPEDLVGHRGIDSVRPENADGLRAMQGQVMRGEIAEFEAPMRTAAGADRWMHVRAKPMLDDDGRVVGRVVGLWDVQASHEAREDLERHEVMANQALAASEERYRLLAENVSDIVLQLSVEGVVTWVSPSVTAILGWTPEDLVGRTTQHIAHPDHWEAAVAQRGRLLSGERVEYEVPMRTAGGDYRWMNIRATPISDELGRPAGLIAGWWDNQAAHDAKEEFERSEHRSAQALAESEHRYRLLAENVSDIVMMGTVEGILSWVSPSVTATLGWAPEDILGTHFRDFVRPDHLGVTFSAMERIQAGEHVRFELPIRTASGDHRWMEMRGRLLFDDDGRVVGRVAALWDVQDAHEAKEQLAEAESRFRMLLENTTEVVFQTVEGMAVWLSPALEEVTGWRPEMVLGSDTKRFWHADDWPRVSAMSDGAEQGTHGREVLRLFTPDGSQRWMEVVIRPYVEPDGRPGTVGMMYDVTDRVLAQEAAKQSEERYRMVAENASDVVCRYSSDGVIDWVSGSTEALAGRTAEELVGTPALSLLVAEDIGDRDEIDGRIARGEVVHRLVRLLRPDGSTRWVELRTRAALTAEGSIDYIIGTWSDAQAEVAYREALAASERQARELVDAFESARDEAIRASTAKTAFLSRMSHELRTPLNAVLGFAQLLALDPLTPEQTEAVHHIRQGGRHLLDLINEIVDISRIEAGRLSLTMQTVDTGAKLAEAVELVRGLAREYDVTVVTEGDPAGVPHLYADQQRVTQVLLNLTSNAVKYNRPGGSVRVGCRIGAPGEVLFEVSDTGLGIPDHLLPRLFEPFDRLGAENSDVEGTGIGLALADALARAMGGRIEVSTKVGAGSTFSLVLRAAPTPASRAEPVDHEPDALRDSRLRILYIEDNPTNATLMERVVALRPGCRLEVAATGGDGLAAMLPEPPDLVFLDVHLPDLSGDEVLQNLRRLPGCADVPVVVVTADASPNVRERMSALGSDGFLTKPLDLADVLGWIDATASAVGDL